MIYIWRRNKNPRTRGWCTFRFQMIYIFALSPIMGETVGCTFHFQMIYIGCIHKYFFATVGCTFNFQMIYIPSTEPCAGCVVGCTFHFQMIYILFNWNSLSYNYLRYLPSGKIPQYKGYQQPHWIFKSEDYHISRLHNYVCKRIYCECTAKIQKIRNNKHFIGC